MTMPQDSCRRRRARSLAVLGLLLGLSGLLMSCHAESSDAQVVSPDFRQKYEYGQVVERSKELEPGMSRFDVLLKLGSPAERDGDRWVYIMDRPGLLFPTIKLIVEFDGQRYVQCREVPVVLGEPLGE